MVGRMPHFWGTRVVVVELAQPPSHLLSKCAGTALLRSEHIRDETTAADGEIPPTVGRTTLARLPSQLLSKYTGTDWLH